jgi:hypothetical protein
MSNREPIDLLIMLKIVEYISMRANNSAGQDQVDMAQIINIVNHLSGDASIGSLLNSGGDFRRDESRGDIYATGQAGAVGPNSLVISQQYIQIWNKSVGEIDLAALAEELARVRSSMRACADSVHDDLALSDLARAELAAKKQDGPQVMAHLAQAGKWALQVAKEIGAEIAAKAILKALGM